MVHEMYKESILKVKQWLFRTDDASDPKNSEAGECLKGKGAAFVCFCEIRF